MRWPALILAPVLALAAVRSPAGDRDRGPGLTGERRGDSVDYRVSGFDKLAIGTAGVAEARVGPSWSLSILGPPEAFKNLRVAVERGRLEIGRRRDDRRDDAERRLRITITMPRLSEAALGGSGSLRIDRVAGGDFMAAVGGSGTMTADRLDVGKARIAVGGSGEVVAAGRARELEVSIGGSGDLRAPGLVAASASVSAAGSGTVRARVEGDANVSLVGSGDVDLGPAARCRVSRMGSGRVHCGR